MALKLISKLLTKYHILTIYFMCSAVTCGAHGLQGHNDELKKILFGEFILNLSSKAEKNFDLISKAAYLTLDYFNNVEQGARFYYDLKNSGVKDLPSLESIDFSGNKYHQKYTHMGWEFNYGVTDKANWEARKKILLNTVDKVFESNKNRRIWSSSRTIHDSKKNDFAALVYDIHILGDHIGDMDATRYTRIRLVSEPGYRGQTVSPTSAGPFNNMTLYTYLLYHIQRLFREQRDSYEYKELIKFLERHKDEFSNHKEDKVPYEEVQFIANETKKVLIKYIPKLLQGEDFFKNAFM